MSKRPVQPDDLLRFILVGDPQLSPDGSRILFTRKTVEGNKTVGQLWTVDLQGATRQWTSGEKGSGGGRWSADGSRVSFTSSREGSDQIHTMPADGGEAVVLTRFPEGSLGEPRLSPDGSRFAVAFRPALETKESKKLREEKGGSEPPVEIDHLLYRYDGDGYFANDRYALYLVDAETGEHTKLLDTDPHGSYDVEWATDSQSLFVIHNATARPFVEPPHKAIWRVELDGAATMLEGLPKGNKEAPRASPDGKWLAWAGDVDEADPWGTRNTKLYVAPVEGGSYRDLTGETDYDLSVATLSDTKDAGGGAVLEWAADSSGLFTQIGWHGAQQLGFVPLAGGVELRTEGRHTITVGNVVGGKVAAVWGDATTLPEVAVVEDGEVRVLTELNKAVQEELEIVAPEEVWIDTTDGLRVHGWVLSPPLQVARLGKGAGGRGEGVTTPTLPSPKGEESSSTPSTWEATPADSSTSLSSPPSADPPTVPPFVPQGEPAVLQVHGGPHTQYGWAFFHEFQCQVAAGLTVVYTNPRGSKGYGEAWTAAIRGDWGVKDWEDVNAVTDWMRARTEKVAIMGGSYGGYMTNWAIGHRHDWACAITDRCVSNLVSMAGNSDFPLNKDGYFGGVAYGGLDDIAALWRQSPLAYLKGATTPTLVIHSVGDLRCNIEQGEQVFAALQMQGVPSRFVRYPVSTSHGMSRSGPPDLRIHRLREILGWLGRYL